MDSVRDRHCDYTKKENDENTDWFSWGVLACQMLVGIHPYKGKHPNFESLPKDQRLDARMKNNVSIFNPDATVPKVCEPFDSIPKALRDWFVAVFDKGVRTPPPADFEAVVAIVAARIKQIVGSDLFEINELQSFSEEIVRVCSTDTISVVVTEKSLHVGNTAYPLPTPDVKLAFSPTQDRPVAFWLDGETLNALDVIKQEKIIQAATGSGLMECDGRVYVQNGTHVIEQKLQELGGKIRIIPSIVGRVLDVPGATQIFDGVILQNMLGTFHASLFPESGKCFQIRLKEPQEYRVVDARYENNVLVIVGVKQGQYDRFVFRFDGKTFKNYDVRITDNITYTGLNFTVADQGIAVLLNDEEKLEAFSNSMSSSSVKVMDDDALEADMKFFHKGTKILFAKGKKLFTIKMK